MGSRDAPQKRQFLGAIKQVASLDPWRKNEKWRKTFTDSTVTEPKSESQYLACFKSPWQGTNMHIWVYV